MFCQIMAWRALNSFRARGRAMRRYEIIGMSWMLPKSAYSERVSRRGWRVVKNERISDLANTSVCAAWLASKMYTPRYV